MSDQSPMHVIASWAGHAGPGSTLSYVHLIEEGLARCCQRARPRAWGSTAVIITPPKGGGADIDVPPTDTPLGLDDGPTPRAFDLGDRRRFLGAIAQGITLSSAAALIGASDRDALAILNALKDALVLARLLVDRPRWTERGLCEVMQSFDTWARASAQPKYTPIRRALDQAVAQGRNPDLVRVHRAWRDCCRDTHLSMCLAQPARRLVDFLLDAGLPKASLLLVSHRDAVLTMPQIGAIGLVQRFVDARPGRPAHRLQIANTMRGATQSSGATVSVVGLHWEMAVLGSHLIAEELG